MSNVERAQKGGFVHEEVTNRFRTSMKGKWKLELAGLNINRGVFSSIQSDNMPSLILRLTKDATLGIVIYYWKGTRWV